jgi:hypothetical protein
VRVEIGAESAAELNRIALRPCVMVSEFPKVEIAGDQANTS